MAWAMLAVGQLAFAGDGAGRWPAAKANAWAAQRPWDCGFNYIPATAINSTEMWAADTFDPVTIDRELGEAQKIGFNAMRVFVQYFVYEQDPDGLKDRLERFLQIADTHGIRVMLVPFDDCYFGHQGPEPIAGKQPEPTPGEYASGFTSSPGPMRVVDPQHWPKLQAYITDLLTWHKDDARVFAWDLYNECTNSGMGRESLPLLRATWHWARAVDPSQPLTSCWWTKDTPELNQFIFENSDIISFHEYSPAADLKTRIAEMKKHGRPVICTEWLNRPKDSVVADCLPVFAAEKVGCLHWGLFNGKTQTNYPWGSKAGSPPPKVWQHDLFKSDGTPYDASELELFKKTIAAMNAPGGRP